MLKQRKIHVVWLKQQKIPSFRLSQILVPNYFWFQRAHQNFGWLVAVRFPLRWLIDLPPEDHVQVPLPKNQITWTHLRDLNLDSKYKKILSRHSHIESYTLTGLLLIRTYIEHSRALRLSSLNSHSKSLMANATFESSNGSNKP